MKTVPGIKMRSGPKAAMRVLCGGCNAHVTSVPIGFRMAARQGEASGAEFLEGKCGRCGEAYRIPIVGED